MRDDEIIKLYFERNEAAITETEAAYGRYMLKIAYNILADTEDCKECVNDTYLKVWNSIPPHRPAVLSAYLGKIARETAIDIYRKQNRSKRKPSEYTFALDEISECVSGKEISRYLHSVSEQSCTVFTMRYYRCDSISDIARHLNMSESKVKGILHRTRKGLKKHLIKEGFEL